jgi:nucleoside-diphosphate-sugar epimerase
MTKSLVIGGSGFVGQELCRQLTQRGDALYVLGRSLRPRDALGHWLQGDITDERSLRAALSDDEFDIVYHTASLPGDTGDPLQMVTVNLLGLTHVLQIARDTRVKRLVLTSSMSALEWYPGTPFSPPDYLPVDEEHPARPRDMYSTTKRAQELLALTFYHQYGVPVSILRLTAVVGPAGRGGGRSWRDFAEQLYAGQSVQLPMFSPQEQCHYVDLRDAARMHIVVGEHPAAIGQIFNCAGPGPTTGVEFAAAVQRLVPGIAVEFGFPWSMAQGGKIAFDMSKARRLLDFAPRFTLEESVRSILEWAEAGGLREDRPASDAGFAAGQSVGQP